MIHESIKWKFHLHQWIHFSPRRRQARHHVHPNEPSPAVPSGVDVPRPERHARGPSSKPPGDRASASPRRRLQQGRAGKNGTHNAGCVVVTNLSCAAYFHLPRDQTGGSRQLSAWSPQISGQQEQRLLACLLSASRTFPCDSPAPALCPTSFPRPPPHPSTSFPVTACWPHPPESQDVLQSANSKFDMNSGTVQKPEALPTFSRIQQLAPCSRIQRLAPWSRIQRLASLG